jgi:hypothetical protein
MPGKFPNPLLIALCTLVAGIFADFAFFMANLKVGFISGSPPPSRAAKVISFEIRVKAAPRLASAAPFFRLIVDHLLCPDIIFQYFALNRY